MKPRNAAGSRPRKVLGWAVLAVFVLAGRGAAQSPGATVAPLNLPVGGLPDSTPPITQISCTGCNSPSYWADAGPGIYGTKHHGSPGCNSCNLGCVDAGCGEAGCAAGFPPCDPCESAHSRLGRMFCAFHNAVCCPDPCYEPRWVPAANAALFVPAVRPGTYTRIRWDGGHNLTQPDRAEYFWAQIGTKGPGSPESRVNYNELSLYAEAGTNKFSFFVNMPYRNQHGDVNRGSGGFGDLSLGTKSVLLDSELILGTFQLATWIPTGLSGRGLGTGHVSIEPSLLYSIKLYTDTYWQGQLGYWIPISGTSGAAGGIVIFNNAVNCVVCRPVKDSAFIASLESMGYCFGSGSVTEANGVVRPANGTAYFSAGPGFRFAFCDKLDLGFGVQFALTSDHFADQLYRAEIRWRF